MTILLWLSQWCKVTTNTDAIYRNSVGCDLSTIINKSLQGYTVYMWTGMQWNFLYYWDITSLYLDKWIPATATAAPSPALHQNFTNSQKEAKLINMPFLTINWCHAKSTDKKKLNWYFSNKQNTLFWAWRDPWVGCDSWKYPCSPHIKYYILHSEWLGGVRLNRHRHRLDSFY